MDELCENKFKTNPVFQRVLADALAIQERFQAEPVYSRTGKGFLKSAGVHELGHIKTNPPPCQEKACGRKKFG